MNTGHVLEQLSAYIDGEADHPELIARHLEQCADCARRHMELSRLSAHLQALPKPETHPAFVTRVMATVAETPLAPARRWWSSVTSLAAAAAVVLCAGGVAYLTVNRHSAPGEDVMATRAPEVVAPDENQLLNQIEERIALGATTPILETDEYTDDPIEGISASALEETANTLERLANSYTAPTPVVEDGEGLPLFDTGVDTLSASEKQAFIDLLNQYAQKG